MLTDIFCLCKGIYEGSQKVVGILVYPIVSLLLTRVSEHHRLGVLIMRAASVF